LVVDSIGVIFGDTGSHDFKFVVSSSSAARRADYIKIWHETDGWVLAQILDITRTSDDFSIENAALSAAGADIGINDEKLIAEALVIGSKDAAGLLRTPRSPFSPGDKIYRADTKLIENSLGLSDGNVYIGKLEGQGLPVRLDANKLVQKHCSILAKTGSGKSYTAGVILEELLDQNIALLIIDPHGEYETLRYAGDAKPKYFEYYGVEPKGYLDKITIYTPANKVVNPLADKLFRMNGVGLTANELVEMVPGIHGANQVGILYEAVQKVRAEVTSYSLDDIIFEVANDTSKSKWSVINALETIRDTGILSGNPTSISELMQHGRASIIDMKGVAPDLQEMIVAHLCGKLFEARKMDLVAPGMIVIEEAHNYCPEKGFSKVRSTDVLRTIASEGRKFGLGMMVISQRPARVDKNVLSQCNTQIIMKVTNPNDLKAITKGLEGIGSEMEEEIKRLPPGVAMIVSNDIERPILVDVRIRKSKHGGESVDVIKARVLDGGEEGQAAVGMNGGMVVGGDGSPITGFSDMVDSGDIAPPDGGRNIITAPPVANTGTDTTSSGHKGTFSKLFGAPKKVEKKDEDVHAHVEKRVPRIVKEPVKDKEEKKEPLKKKKQEPEVAGSLFKKVFGASKK